jgi:hypothetical protein
MTHAVASPCAGAVTPWGQGGLAKLGRCTRCMQLAVLSSAFLWLAVAISLAVAPPVAVTYATVLMASALSGLWLLHITTFVYRATLSYGGMHGGVPGLPPVNRVAFPLRALSQAIRVSIPNRGTLGWVLSRIRQPGFDGCVGCNCYWSSDCGSGQSCSYSSGCTHNGKLDGTCSGGGGFGPTDPIIMARALDLYFRAYEEAISRGGGRPDFNLIAEAMETPLEPHEEWHVFLQDVVHNALDRVIGWDFDFPPTLRLANCFGNIRAVNGVQDSLQNVGVVRDGFKEAVEKNDPKVIGRVLEEWWSQNSQYEPRHHGRCDPHGHDEVTDEASSKSCQTTELTRILEVLLSGQEKAASA